MVGHITLRMLLTHTSGAMYNFFSPDLMRWSAKYNPPQPGVRRSVEEAFKYPLGFQPGTSWMYRVGLDWAGRIVEHVKGSTLGEFAQRRIFDPLGITDAQFNPVTREDLRARMVDLNPDDPDGVGSAFGGGGANDQNRRSKGDFGGHGLFMTAEGYAAVLRSLLTNDGKILEPSVVDDMFRDHLTPAESSGFRAALAGPAGPFFGQGIESGAKTGQGLGGLLTLEGVDGCFGEKTLAWGGGHTFSWFVDRTNGLCGLVALQAKMPFDRGMVMELKNVFRHDVYRKRDEWETKDRAGAL